jgi:hypothetical protein
MSRDIKIISLVEKKDGGVDLEVEVTPGDKERIKSLLGVKRLTRKKFEEFALQAIQHYLAL